MLCAGGTEVGMYPLSFKAIIVIASLIVLSEGAVLGHAVLIVVGLVGTIGPLLLPWIVRLDNWLWPPTSESSEWPRYPSGKR